MQAESTVLRLFARSVLTLALSATAMPALPHPLAPDVDTYIALVATTAECGFGPGIQAALCTSTTNPNFSAHVTGVYTNSLDALASLSNTTMRAEFHSNPAPTLVNNQYIQGLTGYLSGVWFDDITVAGPSPTVQIGVSIHTTGSASKIPRGFSYARWFAAVGARNPNPSPSYEVTADFLSQSPIVQDRGNLLAVFSGPSASSVDSTATGVFTASVGNTFELGYQFSIWGEQTNIDFGNTFTVDFSVPDGYTLTSRRGLAINVAAVPEPSAYALFAAGLLTVAAIARRRLKERRPTKIAPGRFSP